MHSGQFSRCALKQGTIAGGFWGLGWLCNILSKHEEKITRNVWHRPNSEQNERRFLNSQMSKFDVDWKTVRRRFEFDWSGRNSGPVRNSRGNRRVHQTNISKYMGKLLQAWLQHPRRPQTSQKGRNFLESVYALTGVRSRHIIQNLIELGINWGLVYIAWATILWLGVPRHRQHQGAQRVEIHQATKPSVWEHFHWRPTRNDEPSCHIPNYGSAGWHRGDLRAYHRVHGDFDVRNILHKF